MYSTQDERAAIREVQRYLVTVSQIESTIPHVTVDGFYGEETRIAVTEFKKLSGLEPSGVVDFKTFNEIYFRHKAILDGREAKKSVYSLPHYPLTRGDSNDSVLMLNAMLRILSEHYEIPKPKDDSYFSSETADAVVYLKGVFGLEGDEGVNAEFISILSDEILTRQKFAKPL